jgi:hypothetical protein
MTGVENPQSRQGLAPSAACAKRFLTLLDPGAKAFLFVALDDNKERRARWGAGVGEIRKIDRQIERLRSVEPLDLCAIRSLEGEKLQRQQELPAGPEHRLASIDNSIGWMARKQADGFGIFYTVNAMKGKSRRLDEVVRFRAIWAEMDGPQLKAWPIPPSWVNETSSGHFHVGWNLQPDARWTRELWDSVQARIVNDYGADGAAADAARVLRLPGTWNLKKGREPFLVRIVSPQVPL